MKKLLLTSASVAALFAAPAYAQSNTSDVTQSGNANQATVNQPGTLNGSDIDLPFILPRASTDGQWQLLVDTADEPNAQEMEHVEQGQRTPVVARSMKLFIHYAKG